MNWVELKDFPGYFVNRQGEVKGRQGTILKPSKNNKGYPFVNLCKDGKPKCKTVHRIIASTYLTAVDGKPEVNHINRNKEDNRVENLEWTDRKGNLANRVLKENRYGVKGLSWDDSRQRWVAQRMIEGQKFQQRFKNRIDAEEWLKLLELQ